jgi:hypothetical protein
VPIQKQGPEANASGPLSLAVFRWNRSVTEKPAIPTFLAGASIGISISISGRRNLGVTRKHHRVRTSGRVPLAGRLV